MVLVFAVILTSCINVFAAENKEIIKSVTDGVLPTEMKAGTFTVSEASGFMGKESSDKVLKLTSPIGNSDPFFSGAGAMATTDGKTYKKYFVTRFNFLPEQANNLYLRTANNANVVSKIAGTNFKLNQWNSVVIYLDFTNINTEFDYAPITQPTAELKSIPEEYRSEICPIGHVYINGEKVESGFMPTRLQDRFGMINTYYHPTEVNNYLAGTLATISTKGPEHNVDWRLGFNPKDKTQQENAYIDDLYTYYTDVLPDASMPAVTENNMVSVTEGNVLSVYNEKMTVGDLIAPEGSSIAVYDTANYDNLMDRDAYLYDGNLVIVKDSYNQMTYYTVDVQKSNDVTITATTSEITAKANLYNSVMFLAGYDETGKLEEIKYSSNQGGNSLSIDATCYKAKAFLFDSLESLNPVSEPITYKPTTTVACWGDSITKGQGSSGDAYAYPGVLAELTGYDVINMGVGGETATTVAARQGGLEIRLDEDITIPESGAVEIKFSAYEKDGTYAGVVTPRTTAGGWNPCYINGIEGTLSLEVNESVTPRVLNWAKFTRKQSGEAVSVPKGSVMTVEANKTKAHINIFMANANGGWSPENTTPRNSQVQDHIKIFDNMINNTPNKDKFIVIGLTVDGNWDETHAALEEKYGEHFLNIKSYLATEEALSDAGITPTEEDLDAISAKNVPPSLLSADGVHLNDAGYERIGTKVYEKMQQLGYLKDNIVYCWPEHKRKALTLGFDDCVKTDKLVIAEMEEAGVVGTFNIVGEYLNSVSDEDLKIYEGHEIACHSQTHKMTLESSFEDVKADVARGKETLENRFPNHKIFGMARPAGYYSEELMQWLRSSESGISYVRSDYHTGKDCSLNYELPEDWYKWAPTHTLKGIAGYNGSKDYVIEFFDNLKVTSDKDTLKILFTWGHPIYFYIEGHDEGEHSLAAFRKILSEYKEHSSEVWNATHGQVYEYSNALDNLKIDDEARTIYNPSDIDLYVITGGIKQIVKAGETIQY